MKQILHIVRQTKAPMDLIARQAATHQVRVILMQAAADGNLPDSLSDNLPNIPVFVLSEGAEGVSKGVRIGHREMLSLIFGADTVAVW